MPVCNLSLTKPKVRTPRFLRGVKPKNLLGIIFWLTALLFITTGTKDVISPPHSYQRVIKSLLVTLR